MKIEKEIKHYSCQTIPVIGVATFPVSTVRFLLLPVKKKMNIKQPKMKRQIEQRENTSINEDIYNFF